MLKENSIILLYYSCFFSSSNVVGSMESGKNLVTRPFLRKSSACVIDDRTILSSFYDT